MWEEEPWYQKQQMTIIGVLILVVFVVYTSYALIERDWEFLKFVLTLAGGLVLSLGILSGTAWVIVKILTRRKK